jgi:predicted dehydrogenase
VADVDEDAARSAQAEFGVPRQYRDVDELLRSVDVDVLVNCTAASAHGSIIRSAIEYSTDVYCEKPLALDPAEAHELVAAAVDRGIRLAVAPDLALRASVRTMRARLTEGAVGTPHSVYGRYGIDVPRAMPIARRWYYGEGGGVLVDHALYLVTACISVFGRARHVSASMRTAVRERVGVHGPLRVAAEDAATILIEFDDVTAAVQSAFVYGGARGLVFDVFGTEGTLSLTGRDWVSCELAHRTRGETGPIDRVIEIDHTLDVDGLQDFLRARRAGELAMLGYETGLHALEIVTAARESARETKVVLLAEPATEPDSKRAGAPAQTASPAQ